MSKTTYHMPKITKVYYEKHLNSNSPAQGEDEWIIGGTIRMYHMWKREYGTALRKYDPIAFEIGYREYVNETK